MEVIFLPKADKDLHFWTKTGNKGVLKKISFLIRDILDHPFEGIGRPEGLKHGLTGKWSREINKEDRLVYKVSDDFKIVEIYSLKGHYKDLYL